MTPIFNKVAIIGVGLIGGSFGMAAKKFEFAAEVLGVGRNAERLEKARQLSAIDSWSLDIQEALIGADLIYLATPVMHIIETIKSLDFLYPGCIVTDAGSTKEEICQTADTYLPDGVHFVGGHPMAGSEFTGVESANPDLFNGSTYILTPSLASDNDSISKMEDVVHAIGSRLVKLDPFSHDKCVSVVSHLPHIIAASLIKLADSYVQENPQIFDIASGSFRDMTRVASSSPEIWRDICMTNSRNIEESVSKFIKYVMQGVEFVSQKQADEFEEWFRASKFIKDARMQNSNDYE